MKAFKRYWILSGSRGRVDPLPGIGSGLRTVEVWIDEKRQQVHIRADFQPEVLKIALQVWEDEIPHYEATAGQNLGDVARHLRQGGCGPACLI